MTIRNLDHVFRPKSVVLVGASPRAGTIGNIIARNLVEAPFEGEVFLVNPNHEQILGQRVHGALSELDRVPELAVIATPASTVPEIVEELASMGNRAAVVISAGFGERGDPEGRSLCRRVLEAARSHVLRIVGPNCFGIMVPRLRLNAGFSHLHPLDGDIAFVAQSGAVQSAVLDWATSRGIGFSHFVALGDMADVDFGDMLDYLASDSRARSILLYMETVTHAAKFMSAARAAARLKPVIVLKGGRYEESAGAVSSHTGALAGSDDAFDAAFRRAGMLRVHTMQELFDAVEALARIKATVNRGRMVIVTNGGGLGVLALDSLLDEGGEPAVLSEETLARLHEVLPPQWSHGNPVDLVGDATRERYAAGLRVVLDNPRTDAVLALNCPNALLPSLDAAQTVVDILLERRRAGKNRPLLLAAWTGGGSVRQAHELFAREGVPHYGTATEAIRAFMQMVRYRRNQDMLMETPPRTPVEISVDAEAARDVILRALSQGREWLTEVESKSILKAYGIPVLETHFAATPREAGELAEKIGRPVVLKILSPHIVHKSEAGGVHLNLEGRDQVECAAQWMVRRVAEASPGGCAGELHGFSVQEMVFFPNAQELIVGMTGDVHFGPVLVFGQGGVSTEIVRDRALALPPLNMHLAMEMMSRTRIHKILQGYRNVPPVDNQAVALTLVQVSRLVCDMAHIVEMDINPLVAHAGGVLALDAGIRIAETSGSPQKRPAIRPYPNELEEVIPMADGTRLKIRPIRPEDEPAFQELFKKLTPEEIRLRFMHPMREMPHGMAARLTQIDYDREMALVLLDLDEEGEGALLGVVRIIGDPDGERAEFSILIRKDRTGLGLGPMLLRRIIEYGRKRGIREIWGEVLPDNLPMLKLAGALGFSRRRDPEDPSLVHVVLQLEDS